MQKLQKHRYSITQSMNSNWWYALKSPWEDGHLLNCHKYYQPTSISPLTLTDGSVVVGGHSQSRLVGELWQNYSLFISYTYKTLDISRSNFPYLCRFIALKYQFVEQNDFKSFPVHL